MRVAFPEGQWRSTKEAGVEGVLPDSAAKGGAEGAPPAKQRQPVKEDGYVGLPTHPAPGAGRAGLLPRRVWRPAKEGGGTGGGPPGGKEPRR